MKTVVSITYVFRYAMPPFQVGKSNQKSICMFNYVHTLLLCSIYTLKGLYDIYGFEFGLHFERNIEVFQVHTQVLITSWVLPTILFKPTIPAI